MDFSHFVFFAVLKAVESIPFILVAVLLMSPAAKLPSRQAGLLAGALVGSLLLALSMLIRLRLGGGASGSIAMPVFCAAAGFFWGGRSCRKRVAEEMAPRMEKSDRQKGGAQYWQARRLIDAQKTPEDVPSARRLFREAAEQGHVQAQTELGFMVLYGWGGPADAAEAAAWLKKGADGGDPRAMMGLSLLAERGIGMERDWDAAARLRKAAFAGGGTKAMDAFRKATEARLSESGFPA
ncbi:MAG: sel1 repeat family protein [Desulfovibrio sp.]|nr:sel1 repeat family protein [Desulfovibrio sp.]